MGLAVLHPNHGAWGYPGAFTFVFRTDGGNLYRVGPDLVKTSSSPLQGEGDLCRASVCSWSSLWAHRKSHGKMALEQFSVWNKLL